MAIAIIGSEGVSDWQKTEHLISLIINSLNKRNIKIITGYNRGINAIVRGSLWKYGYLINCEFDNDIIRAIKHSKGKQGLVVFSSEYCPSAINLTSCVKNQKTPNIWDLVATSVKNDLATILFLEQQIKPPDWNGGKWAKAGSGLWEGAVKWIKEG